MRICSYRINVYLYGNKSILLCMIVMYNGYIILKFSKWRIFSFSKYKFESRIIYISCNKSMEITQVYIV